MDPPPDPSSSLLFKATLAKDASRFDDMFKIMVEVVLASEAGISKEAFEMLELAFKELTSSQLQSLEVLSSIEEKNIDDHLIAWVKKSVVNVQTELNELLQRMLSLVESHLLPSSTSSESKVSCLKIKGECYMINARLKTGSEMAEEIEKAKDVLNLAESIASVDLASTNPTRLSVQQTLATLYIDTRLPKSSLEREVCKDILLDHVTATDARRKLKELEVLMEASAWRVRELRQILGVEKYPAIGATSSSSGAQLEVRLAAGRKFLKEAFRGNSGPCWRCFWDLGETTAVTHFLLEEHNNACHENLKVVCVTCKNRFKSSDELLDHETLCHGP